MPSDQGLYECCEAISPDASCEMDAGANFTVRSSGMTLSRF